MNERGFQLDRDGLGILLFTIGAFFAVLLGYSLLHELPASGAGGTAALARAWIDGLGLLPSMFLCASMAWIGARLFLQGQRDGVFRTLGRLAAVAIAAAILLGALSPAGGGALGAAIGGKLTQATHLVVGMLAGLAALAFVVWASWLRAPRAEGELAHAPENGTTPAIESDGVSAAEAAALIPEDFTRILIPGRKQAEHSTPRAAAPPSPYPEDVRRRGEIPAGARPLHTAEHAQTVATPDAPQAGSVYRWTAARTAEPADSAGAHLAAGALDDAAEHEQPVAEVLELELGLVEPEAEVMSVAEIAEPERAELKRAEVDAPRVVEPAGIDVQVLPAMPRPSWEQSSLFEEGEEPVDAYGTPLSLIESLLEPVADVAVAEPRAESALPAALEEDFEPIDDEDEDDEDEDEEEDDDDWLDDDEDEDEDDLDDDDDEEDEEEDEDEDDEDELDDEEDEDEEDEDEDLAEEDSAAPILPAESKPPKFDIAARIAALEALEARAPSEPQLFAEQEAPQTTPLAAQLSPRPPAAPTVATSASPANERQIVLQPQAPPRDHVLKAPSGTDRTQLLTEVGCLFVERGRVAVSMLQRQYAMDFDEACKVLDELQELGLIGPYLGGQRRDILLTREQWLEKVASIASS